MRSSTSFAIRAFVVAVVLASALGFAGRARAGDSPIAFNLAQSHFEASKVRLPRRSHTLGRQIADFSLREPEIGQSDVIREASRFINSGNPTGFAGQWCKAFTNFVLRRLGYHPGPSLRAIDALRDGVRVANPQPGDLAVMYPHVTFFDGFDGAGGFIGLGGNQHRTVARSHFSLARVVAFIRPK